MHKCHLSFYVAQCGQVSNLTSDNGTNFIGAEELRETIVKVDHEKIQHALL